MTELLKNKVELSIVTPMYNEEDVVEIYLKKIIPTLDKITKQYEIVCVNDGSHDNTWDKLTLHEKDNSHIKIINLSRNFGKEIALTAGLHHASGDAVIPLDCDLQDPPELISEMYQKWKEGYDVVLARRIDRSSDSFLKRWTSKKFYSLLDKISDIKIPANVGDFRLIDRKVLNYLNQYPERSRFMKGIFATLGFKEAVIEYKRPERAAGKTKWNYFQLYKLALEGIFSFTSFPLKIWSYIGGITSILSFTYGVILIIRTLIYGVDAPGYASLMVTVLFMSGLILLCLGVIGEYLSRIFIEVKCRPLYIVMEKKGFENNQAN